MKVGVPREVKVHEYRVALTPLGVHELVEHGHEVVVEAGAGEGSQVPDEEYAAAGATLLPTADDGDSIDFAPHLSQECISRRQFLRQCKTCL